MQKLVTGVEVLEGAYRQLAARTIPLAGCTVLVIAATLTQARQELTVMDAVTPSPLFKPKPPPPPPSPQVPHKRGGNTCWKVKSAGVFGRSQVSTTGTCCCYFH